MQHLRAAHVIRLTHATTPRDSAAGAPLATPLARLRDAGDGAPRRTTAIGAPGGLLRLPVASPAPGSAAPPSATSRIGARPRSPVGRPLAAGDAAGGRAAGAAAAAAAAATAAAAAAAAAATAAAEREAEERRREEEMEAAVAVGQARPVPPP